MGTRRTGRCVAAGRERKVLIQYPQSQAKEASAREKPYLPTSCRQPQGLQPYGQLKHTSSEMQSLASVRESWDMKKKQAFATRNTQISTLVFQKDLEVLL